MSRPAMLDASGILSLDDRCVRHSSPVFGDWSLPLADLAIVGEYTSQDGPADDYFLVFITEDLEAYEASYYAAGVQDALDALAREFGAPLDLGLNNSADFASRVLWPFPLSGQPLYDFREVYPPGRWRWLRRLLRLPHMERRLAESIRRTG